MSGSMTTFGTDRRTDRQTDGADYIGPAVGPDGPGPKTNLEI